MSTAINPAHTAVPTASSRAPSIPATHSPIDSYTNSHHHHHHHDTGAHPAPAANAGKKGKQKKATDPNEASKLIAAKISQLELDAAGEKDQEAEIEREVKKANRELNNLTSKMDDLQKIETLQRRATDYLAEMKRLERDNIKNKKRGDSLQKEKDHGRTELSKTISLKEKLEKLCRELQRENNRLKGENKTLQDAERANRTAWDEKFHQVLWQLQGYQESKDHPPAQVMNMEIDEIFKQRFKSFIEQYELRELHFHSLLRTKELEVQYHMARYEDRRKAAEAEMSRSRALNAQVLTFSKTETELRNQLNIYVEKFKQVEDTLNNSNDLFLTFRKEMEEMSKKTKRLEKENVTLTRKHEATNQSILKMAEERTKNNQELEMVRKENETSRSIIAQMRKQGRGVPEGMAGMADGGEYVEGDLDVTESESEGDLEEELSEGEAYDDDTEDEAQPKLYGPERPPQHPVTNGVVNGIKH